MRPARRGALRELPAPQAQRIAELLDQLEAVAVARDHQRVRRLVDDRRRCRPLPSGRRISSSRSVIQLFR